MVEGATDTIRLLTAVYQAAGYRTSPILVSLTSLRLRASREEIDKAVVEALSVGWLATSGMPAHLVRLTRSGIEELERRRLA